MDAGWRVPIALWVVIVAGIGGLCLLLFAVAASLVKRRRARRQSDTADDSTTDALYLALPREARQFLVAVVQADTQVVVIGPRDRAVLDFLRALVALIRGRKPVLKLSRPTDLVTFVSRQASCLAYLDAPGLVSGIAKMRSLLGGGSPALTPTEVWQAIEESVDLMVVVRPEEGGGARVETITEPTPSEPGEALADHRLARVIFGRDTASGDLAATGVRPAVLTKLERAGILLPDHLFARRS